MQPAFDMIHQLSAARTDLEIERDRLDGQCREMLDTLRLCQSALASVVSPDAIRKTTLLNAFAQLTEAEAAARDVIAKFEATAGEGE